MVVKIAFRPELRIAVPLADVQRQRAFERPGKRVAARKS